MFDDNGVGELSPLGKRYLEGQLTQAKLTGRVELSRQGDIPEHQSLSPRELDELREVAWTVLPGRVAFCVLAAGASSRMDLKRVPPRVWEMLKVSGRSELPLSKALVPVAERDGKVLTFLDMFLEDVSHLSSRCKLDNPVVVFVSDANADEVEAFLRVYRGGDDSDRHLVFRQPLSAQLVAKVEDVERARGNFATEQDFRSAIEFSGSFAGRELELGKPAGHGEFLHQLIASGALGELFRRGVEYLFVRNIDNAAATLDEDWLAVLGYAVGRELDAVVEVAQRLPGQKGGALIRCDGAWRIAEDPSFVGSGKEARDSFYINNAVAILSLNYLTGLYRTSMDELLRADASQLAEIAERGRSRFPTLIDAKPTNLRGRIVGAVTPETNMWESTSVAQQARVGAFGVRSEKDVGEDFMMVDQDERRRRALQVRFSPTKSWEDYNDPVKQAILEALARRADLQA